MASRYDNLQIITNATQEYAEHARRRKTNQFRQFKSPRLRHQTAKDVIGLTSFKHIWSSGDRFYNLAFKHYGNAKLWWVIAWYNKTPTEAHLKLGDVIFIPRPLERIKGVLEMR